MVWRCVSLNDYLNCVILIVILTVILIVILTVIRTYRLSSQSTFNWKLENNPLCAFQLSTLPRISRITPKFAFYYFYYSLALLPPASRSRQEASLKTSKTLPNSDFQSINWSTYQSTSAVLLQAVGSYLIVWLISEMTSTNRIRSTSRSYLAFLKSSLLGSLKRLQLMREH